MTDIWNVLVIKTVDEVASCKLRHFEYGSKILNSSEKQIKNL